MEDEKQNDKVEAPAPAAEPVQPQFEQQTQRKRREPRKSFRPRIVASDYIEKVVTINRITKVTKGGKKMSFSALVVVGDGKGRVGYSIDKSNDVAGAIKKSLVQAKKNMFTVPLHGLTIPHEIIGHWGAATVLLKPASDGTGVIAAGPVRAICDAAGIRNILTKCHRSNNPINVIRATRDGLNRLKTRPQEIKQEVKTEQVT